MTDFADVLNQMKQQITDVFGTPAPALDRRPRQPDRVRRVHRLRELGYFGTAFGLDRRMYADALGVREDGD